MTTLITRRGFMSTCENSRVLINNYRKLDRKTIPELYQLLLMFLTIEHNVCLDVISLDDILCPIEDGDPNELLYFIEDLNRLDKSILLSSAYKIINGVIHETNIGRLHNVLTEMLYIMSNVREM